MADLTFWWSAIFRVLVASAWREAGRRAEQAAVEERLEGARQDRPPCLQAGQLLRSFGQACQERGDGGKRLGGGLGLGVRTRHADRCLPCVPRARGDGRQKQRPAGDRLAVEMRVGEADKDVPPIVKQRKQPGREPATRQVVRREAAPAPLVLHGAIDTEIFGVSLHASSQRTFGSYNDLASIIANYYQNISAYPAAWSAGANSWDLLTTLQPPKCLDTISLGVPLPFGKSSFSAAYVHLVPVVGTPSNLATLSYSRTLFDKATASITAFTDLSNRKNTGFFFGLSIPLDSPPSSPAPTSLSASLSRSNGGATGGVEAMKALTPEPGNYGYDTRDSEGATPDRYAAASYRSSIGQLDGYAEQFNHQLNATVQAQGSIATMGGDVFLSNRIDDSFAVVDAGAPGVKVLYENRPAGSTDSQGLALIPTLRSYQANKVSIDALDLPLNAEASITQDVVAPANRSGVLVKFGVKTDLKAAVVILIHKDGSVLSAGASGHLEGGNETFVVGYDGRAYVKGLAPTNTVVVADGQNECRASFPYELRQDSQVSIGPVVCQ